MLIFCGDKLSYAFPVMFCVVFNSDELKGPYEQSCSQCQIKNELIERGRYIFVHESLSGFSLELFCRSFHIFEINSKFEWQ